MFPHIKNWQKKFTLCSVDIHWTYIFQYGEISAVLIRLAVIFMKFWSKSWELAALGWGLIHVLVTLVFWKEMEPFI